jgi:hypothetical protein
MILEKLRNLFRKKTEVVESPWGVAAPKTDAYPLEKYRVKLLKMPKTVTSRRRLIFVATVLSGLLVVACIVGQAALVAPFFLIFGLLMVDYYRFLGRLRVES